jgi:hypothetical protein
MNKRCFSSHCWIKSFVTLSLSASFSGKASLANKELKNVLSACCVGGRRAKKSVSASLLLENSAASSLAVTLLLLLVVLLLLLLLLLAASPSPAINRRAYHSFQSTAGPKTS